MYLKRLELLGFKSFAARTVLELDRGATALVGPNGCGKSNVVDAVRWALGEQSLRAVRTRKSEELIFAGNGRRAPVGMAEVTLVLDNAEATLPLPFPEVSVTRRLYRSGEGEYLINRARARLRDVVELLSHASLGPDAYAVVGQGAVDELLLQRPEERRGLLEAAADISRHQLKLRECLDKLAQTEANLRRVEDIQGEIAPRLPRLRAQANRARRHEGLAARLREMLRWRCLLHLQGARQRAASRLELERARAEVVLQSSSKQEEARRRAAGLRDRLQEEQAALESARERVSGLRAARAKYEREVALAQERAEARRRQLSQAETELTEAREELGELKAEVEKLTALQAELQHRASTARAELAPAEAEQRRLLSEQRLLQAQLERGMGEHQGLARRASDLRERRASLVRELRRAEEVRSESLQAADEAAERLARMEEQARVAREELARLRAELALAETRHQEARARLRAVETGLQAARKQERECWERDNDLGNRLSLLQSLKEEHRGVPAGARAILDARLPGIRGILASTIVVPQEYVTAVAAALGGAQGYVVSEGFREGLEALEFLSSHSGRATIAPLRLEERDSLRPLLTEFRARLDALVHGIAFRGVAADLVSCEPEAEDLCARYLGFSLVVEEMRDALELYHRLRRLAAGRLPFQVVTLDGRLLRSRGDLVSDQSNGKSAGLLARETELQSVAEVAAQARARLAEARAKVAVLESAQADLTREVAAEPGGSILHGKIAKQSGVLAELASQVAKGEAGIEWHRSRAATAEVESTRGRDALARVEKELSETTVRESEAGSRAEQLRGDLAEQQSLVAQVAARLSRLQSEEVAAQSRLRELGARTSAVTEGLQRAEARVRRQEEKVAVLSTELAEMDVHSRVDLPAPTLEELESAERLASEASTRSVELRREYDAAEVELAALFRRQEAEREELSQARSMIQRASAELAALLREASRESGVELSEETDGGDDFGDAPPPSGELAGHLRLAHRLEQRLGVLLAEAPTDSFPKTPAAASEKVGELQRELGALGTINAEAPEEYRLLSERHAFLSAQLDDLKRAERTLRKAIEELRSVMGTRFQEAFDRVNSEFGRCFSALFGGGSARLALTQPDQPLEGGVEVVATPPGRKGGGLLGLSGGERALTTIALLFALMRVKPSPFCVLDEVDAALDESNVRRFCTMVRELTDSTQFLLVTHNRATMEMAGALHGVSVLPDSTSRLVSLRLASEES